MVECFWCDTFYNETVEDKCPNCLSKTGSPVTESTEHWRYDRSFMERICAHGVGHPDPDGTNADPLHACDGCCTNETP